MQNRLSDIESLAESIAESYFPHERVDPICLLDSKKITHSFGRYGDFFDGLLEYRNQRFHIYTNADRIKSIDDQRCRFTLAHELGHYFIDDHRRSLESGVGYHPSVVDFQSDNKAEREADSFAAFLLMPSERFASEARKSAISADSICSLARMFGTSLTSTTIRFTKLSDKPVIVMKWTVDGRSWSWGSESFRELARTKSISKVSELPEGCLTQEILNLGQSNNTQSRATTLSSWFPRISQASRSNILMIEEVMPLGKYGLLTLLYSDEQFGPKNYW